MELDVVGYCEYSAASFFLVEGENWVCEGVRHVNVGDGAADYLGTVTLGRAAHVGSQPQLGLRSGRRGGAAARDLDRAAHHGPHLVHVGVGTSNFWEYESWAGYWVFC